MKEEIVRYSPETTSDSSSPDWEDDITDAPRDAPRKAVWIPMGLKAGHWYLSRERGIHNLVNAVLREYMESEIARQQGEPRGEEE